MVAYRAITTLVLTIVLSYPIDLYKLLPSLLQIRQGFRHLIRQWKKF